MQSEGDLELISERIMFGTMEVISFLNDPFMILVDRIMSLKPIKVRRKQWVFKEIVEPLFMGFQIVLDNYLFVLRETQQLLYECNQSDLQKSIITLRYMREAILISRKRVRTLCSRVSEMTNDPMVIKFSNNLEKFFYRTVFKEVFEEISLSSKMQLAEVIDFATHQNIEETALKALCDKALSIGDKALFIINKDQSEISIHRNEMLDLRMSYFQNKKRRIRNNPLELLIDVLLIDLEYSWERIAKSYALTRIHCLSSSGK